MDDPVDVWLVAIRRDPKVRWVRPARSILSERVEGIFA